MAMNAKPGRYAAEILDHSLTEAKTKTLQLAFRVLILGMVNPKDPENLEPEGRGLERTIFRPITDGTAQYVWRDLDNLGYAGDTFDPLDEEKAAAAGVDFVSLAGKPVYVRCKENNFNGQVNERWDFDMVGQGPSLNAADGSKVREANARFGRKAVQGKGSARPAAAPAPTTGAPIPF